MASSAASEAKTDAAIDRRDNEHNRSDDVISAITFNAKEEQDLSYEISLADSTILVGRDDEINQIRSAYRRAKKGKSEVVLVSGSSGSGKSSLIEKFREYVARDDGYFVSGKYDQFGTNEPFSAIAASFSDICDVVLLSPEVEEIRAILSDTIGYDGGILCKLVSNLTKLATPAEDFSIDSASSAANVESFHENDFTRLQMACLNFVRSVATQKRPLLLFLDDLQWADALSIKILRALIRDNDSKHVLFCFTYRNDEIDAKELLGLHTQHSDTLPITHMEIENLKEADVRGFLCLMLLRDQKSVQSMCNLFMDKTQGSPYAVVQFLDNLRSKNLVKYKVDEGCWEWNLTAIESEVMEDPAAIINAKIGRLDDRVQELLKFAAFIGHTFSVEVLHAITSEPSLLSGDTQVVEFSEIRASLQAAVEQRLLLQPTSKQYRFSHDSVQSAVYNSVEQAEHAELHHRVGRNLMRQIQSGNKDPSLTFLAASSMMRAIERNTTEIERLETIQLLLDAGCQAASQTAFLEAQKYISCAMDLLQRERDFEENNDLCSNVMNIFAEIQNCMGHFVECDEALDIVLRCATSRKERSRANLTKIRSLASREHFGEMISWACNVCRNEFRERIPKNPSGMHVMAEYARTKIAMRNMTPRDFLDKASDIINEEQLEFMKVLSTITPHLFFLQRKMLYAFCGLRIVRASARYGTSEHTADGLAVTAVFLAGTGDYQQAHEITNVAIELSQRYGLPGPISRCWSSSSSLVLHYVDPLEQLLDGMMTSYKSGLKNSGDLAVAFLGIIGYVEAQLYLGMNLVKLEQLLRKYCDQMKQMHAFEPLHISLCNWQTVLNLLGQSDDRTSLNGEALTEKSHLKSVRSAGFTMGEHLMNTKKLELLLMFEDWENMEPTMLEVVKLQATFQGPFVEFFIVTNIALAAVGLYQISNDRRHRTIARRQINIIRKWDRKGAPLAKPMLSLLEAEWTYAVIKRPAKKAYETAIAMLKERRLVFLESYAYQRTMHCLSTINKKLSQDCLHANLDLCQAWGNKAKEEWLKSEYADVLRSVKPIVIVQLSLNDSNSRIS